MTSVQGDVAALLKIAATEPATLDALEGSVRRLREVQAAKRELARMPPATLDALEGSVRRLREVQTAKRELARMPPATLLSGLLERQGPDRDPS